MRLNEARMFKMSQLAHETAKSAKLFLRDTRSLVENAGDVDKMFFGFTVNHDLPFRPTGKDLRFFQSLLYKLMPI